MLEGRAVVGLRVGERDGFFDGRAVVGLVVGFFDGVDVVGDLEGLVVGLFVGLKVGGVGRIVTHAQLSKLQTGLLQATSHLFTPGPPTII